MSDGELSAVQLVLGRRFSVERDGGRVLITLRRDVPLVTWSLTPAAGAVAGGPRLTEWAEHLGGTANTALREIGDDSAAAADRIERIVRVTERSAQAFGDDYRVAVEAVHTDDPDDWFR